VIFRSPKSNILLKKFPAAAQFIKAGHVLVDAAIKAIKSEDMSIIEIPEDAFAS
jgi:hypothetical protein